MVTGQFSWQVMAMGEIRLFRFDNCSATMLPSIYFSQESELHALMEQNLEEFLGLRFLAREYNTGRYQRGYIDTLALDEDFCPVIIEYKRHNNDNIITQGLYYLNWLMDHQPEFMKLAESILGREAAEKIDYSNPRLICIAAEFSKFDEKAILQIDRNIELYRYRIFDSNLLLLELVGSTLSPFLRGEPTISLEGEKSVGMPASFQTRLKNMNYEMERLYLETMDFAEGLGDDVTIKFLKHYVAISRLRNFASIQPARSRLKLWLNLNPDEITLEAGFSRDVTTIGHHASGNLEIYLRESGDLEKAKPLIELAYQKN